MGKRKIILTFWNILAQILEGGGGGGIMFSSNRIKLKLSVERWINTSWLKITAVAYKPVADIKKIVFRVPYVYILTEKGKLWVEGVVLSKCQSLGHIVYYSFQLVILPTSIMDVVILGDSYWSTSSSPLHFLMYPVVNEKQWKQHIM